MKKELTSQQLEAISALLTGSNYNEAAEKVGVSLTTLRRWRDSKVFSKELKQQKAEIIGQARNKLSDSAVDSIQVLKDIRDSDGERSTIKYRCASKLLDLALQVGEIEQLQAEIDELRERLDASGK